MTAPNQLSFLPEDYLERKARRRTNVVFGGLFAVCLAAVGSTFWMSERTNRDVEAAYAAVEADYSTAALQIVKVEQMHAKQRQIVQHAELAAALVERVPKSNVLAELTNALPPSTSLLDVVMEAKPRPAPAPPANATAFDQKKAAREAAAGKGPEAQPMDVFIKLTGIADNDVQVAQFISRLNQSKLLKDVNLVISDVHTIDKQTMRRFQIDMTVHPAAEVREGTVGAKAVATAGEEK